MVACEERILERNSEGAAVNTLSALAGLTGEGSAPNFNPSYGQTDDTVRPILIS